MMAVSSAMSPLEQMGRQAAIAGSIEDCNPIEREMLRLQAEARARALEAKTQSILGRAAIPPRFANRRLGTFQAECHGSKRALAIATEYAEDFSDVLLQGRSMLFLGSVGTGKTHLAVGIAHAVIEQGYEALFSSVLSAIRSVKECYSRDSQVTEAQAIRRLVEPALLILDEVGLQFGSEAEKLILFEIMNGRYENLKPTILLSNLGVADMEKYLGQRVMDRLREGGGKAVTFDWESYRGRI